jgi:hypothetical protein
MAVKKLKRSLLETTLITIVRFVLSVRATLSTRVNSIRTRRKKPVKKAESEVVDLKPENLLEDSELNFVDSPRKIKIYSVIKDFDKATKMLDEAINRLKKKGKK